MYEEVWILLEVVNMIFLFLFSGAVNLLQHVMFNRQNQATKHEHINLALVDLHAKEPERRTHILVTRGSILCLFLVSVLLLLFDFPLRENLRILQISENQLRICTVRELKSTTLCDSANLHLNTCEPELEERNAQSAFPDSIPISWRSRKELYLVYPSLDSQTSSEKAFDSNWPDKVIKSIDSKECNANEWNRARGILDYTWE